MNKMIELADTEKRKNICRTYGCTNTSISQALRFQINSKQAHAIRKMALENGGRLWECMVINDINKAIKL